ncbi:MobF family relaxase [Telmatobacter bradus]|uniref:MobF family relaxase n=1 Tax=Telmatobacter bradus TaxID=474953 RepID=UPI003B42D3B7
MLTISKSLSASQAQTYHKQDFASETQSYYRQGIAIEGEWQGQLAMRFGLSGAVSPLEFQRLSEGLHPATEQPMVRSRAAFEYKNADGATIKSVEHRAGWDATFSAPKSVSLTALVGGDDRVREAHRTAVTEALNALERYTQARIGGNHPAETTSKFIAAKFEHDTARPVAGYAAPQLHTHAVIFNVTERADGTTRALQERGFFESQQFATAVYQSELMYRLRNLGYEIERGKSGAPEIKGYTQEYLDASSPRSRQIREQLERTGRAGAEAAEIAAHSTRDRKQNLTAEQVLDAHRKMAVEFGNQPEQVVAAAQERARRQHVQPGTSDKAKEAVTFARESVFEREAVADERRILRDAMRRGMGETTYKEIRSEFEVRRAAGDFQIIDSPKYASGRRFSTQETIAAERANVEFMFGGRNTVEPILSAEQAQEQARSRDFLNEAQQRVIEETLNSTDRIHGLQGRAGTGKTTVVQSIREGAEKSGYIVEGFAPTSRAAAQLREAGIDSSTLQSFLARGENHPSANIELRHFYMLDESSLASTRQMRAFLEKLKPQDRVLVIGDTSQHQAVDAGRPFEQMQQAGMRTSQLDQIMRQKDPELRRAVELLAANDTEKGVALLAEQGRVTEIAGTNERITAIAKDYAAQPENTIIVSPDNRSRRQINEAVRAELLLNGTLGTDGYEVRVLDHRSDMTGADRTWAARYNIDDVLHYHTGSKAEGIARNSFARVQDVDARANTLTVELENGSSVSYDPRRLRGVNVFVEETREFSTGDRIQFTEPSKALGVANRDLGTITAIDNGQMTVRLDGKQPREIVFDTEQFRQFDHGYAVTSHSSQGLTAGRVLANIDTESSRMLINTRLAYVSVSRASDDARIYTNNAETLGQRLATDISKTAAVDFRSPSTTEQTREAVQFFREHQPAAATEQLKQQGRVHEYQSSGHRLAAVVMDYTAQPERTIVVAPDAAERRELTQLIRAELQSEGKLAAESRAVSVLVEQKFANPHFAGNYWPGDEIHFRTGSPVLEGIPHNSSARVLEVDAHQNTLTIETADGGQVTYNPAQLRPQTRQSRVYREEPREMAEGERIRFTLFDNESHIRSGDFATVERIEPDLAARLDSGKTVELDAEAAQHIDYGYAAESAANLAADRVILTGEAQQLAGLENDLARLNPSIRELSVYTSDASQVLQVEHAQSPAATETLSKSLAENANFGIEKATLAESLIEEIGLHL